MEVNLLEQFWADAKLAFPFWGWAASAVIILLLQIFGVKRSVSSGAGGLCLAALLVYSIWSFDSGANISLFFGAVNLDALSQTLNIVALGIALSVFLMCLPGFINPSKFYAENYSQFPEFLCCLLISGFGIAVAVSAVDLTSFFLGFEALSIGTYAMCGFFRSEVRSTEAALKYLFVGAFATVIFLYGIAMLYGATGSTSYVDIAAVIVAGPEPLVLLGTIFIVAGLSFKLAFIPFHFYAPEVYEGAPTPVTAYMATAMKVAVIGAGIRLLWGVLGPVSHLWEPMWIALCLVSIIVGNVWALQQVTLKKLLAFSSISHAGFLGLAVLIASPAAAEWPLFPVLTYLVVYVSMSLGIFALISWMEDRDQVFHVDDLRGLVNRRPALSLLFALFAIGLAGFPPFAGFIVKLLVFQALIAQGYTAVAVLAVIGAIIGAAYYLRIIMLIFMSGSEEGAAGQWTGLVDRFYSVRLIIAFAAAITLVGGLMPTIYADRVMEALGRSVVVEETQR